MRIAGVHPHSPRLQVRGSEMAKIFPLLPLGVSVLFFGIGMLLYIGGPVTLIGVGVMFCLLFMTAQLGLRSKHAQAAYQACADETINVIREAVEGVKVVKMQVWEEAYIEAIRRKRSRETHQLRRVRVLITIIMTTGRLSPLVGFATTVVHTPHPSAAPPHPCTPPRAPPRQLCTRSAPAPRLLCTRPTPVRTPAPHTPAAPFCAHAGDPLGHPRLAQRLCGLPDAAAIHGTAHTLHHAASRHTVRRAGDH